MQPKLTLTRDSRLLFIGDSITDCGQRTDADGHLGSGYVRLVRDYLAARDPANAPAVINRGISGNRVTHLAGRWERDVIASDPHVVSIKVGINDVWHGLGGRNEGVPVGQYVEVYRDLLRQVRDKLPNCAIVLCEPSVIWAPAPAEGNDLIEPYVKAVGELAREFSAAALVPLHGAFENARRLRPDIVWAPDGVHPGTPGHMLIARTWLSATGLL